MYTCHISICGGCEDAFAFVASVWGIVGLLLLLIYDEVKGLGGRG